MSPCPSPSQTPSRHRRPRWLAAAAVALTTVAAGLVAVVNAPVKTRLATIEGHIKGIRKMVSDDTYCVDILKQAFAVERALNGELTDARRSLLRDIERYASGVGCRHRYLVSYFGERYEKAQCGACDYCMSGQPRHCAQAKGVMGRCERADRAPCLARSGHDTLAARIEPPRARFRGR